MCAAIVSSAREEFRPPAPVPPSTRLGLIKLLGRLKRNPLECWSAEFFREPIVEVALPFARAYLVNDPHAIKRVLVDNADNYRKDPIQRRILSTGLADGLLGVEGDRWQVQRRMLAPLFARKAVTTFEAAMLSGADWIADRWTRIGLPAQVDAAGEMTLLTLQVLALTIFSDGIAGDLDEFRAAMKSYFESIGRIDALDLFGVPNFVPRPGGKALQRTIAYFEKTIDEIIHARRRRLFAPDGLEEDLLTLLLRALDPASGRRMNLLEVRSNILTFLSAGHETTANTLVWSLFLLSQSPYWYARVQEEGDRELTGSTAGLAERLVVTRAVVEESLRLYPPISALSRIANGADELDGRPIRPGSLIVIAPYVLHRHERLWERPNVFDPARFLGRAKQTIARFSYLPFGTGPRTCIGSTFALQEATLVLATLLHRFEIELADGAEIWPLQRVTLRPANGLPMKVTPRRDS